MNSQIFWDHLFSLQSIEKSAAYLKMMSEVWGVQVQSIVEIGVFRGETSRQFRALFSDAFLYLIDPWQLYDDYLSVEAGPISKIPSDYEKAYRKVKQMFKFDRNVKILRKTSTEALADVPDNLDLIYIDGNHSYSNVKEDIQQWLPKICLHGMLSGHDYNPYCFPWVIQAVDEIFPEGVSVGQDFNWLIQKRNH